MFNGKHSFLVSIFGTTALASGVVVAVLFGWATPDVASPTLAQAGTRTFSKQANGTIPADANNGTLFSGADYTAVDQIGGTTVTAVGIKPWTLFKFDPSYGDHFVWRGRTSVTPSSTSYLRFEYFNGSTWTTIRSITNTTTYGNCVSGICEQAFNLNTYPKGDGVQFYIRVHHNTTVSTTLTTDFWSATDFRVSAEATGTLPGNMAYGIPPNDASTVYTASQLTATSAIGDGQTLSVTGSTPYLLFKFDKNKHGGLTGISARLRTSVPVSASTPLKIQYNSYGTWYDYQTYTSGCLSTANTYCTYYIGGNQFGYAPFSSWTMLRLTQTTTSGAIEVDYLTFDYYRYGAQATASLPSDASVSPSFTAGDVTAVGTADDGLTVSVSGNTPLFTFLQLSYDTPIGPNASSQAPLQDGRGFGFVWRGRSSVAWSPSSPLLFQYYTGSAWQTFRSVTDGCAANTLCTYYLGFGSSYYPYLRVYQASASATLETDYYSVDSQNAVYTQSGYQFLNDDTGAALPTPQLSKNISRVIAPYERFILRFILEQTGNDSGYVCTESQGCTGGSAFGPTYQLEFREKGVGSWQDVTVSTPVVVTEMLSSPPASVPAVADSCRIISPWATISVWGSASNTIEQTTGYGATTECFYVSYALAVAPWATPGNAYEFRVVIPSTGQDIEYAHTPETLNAYLRYPEVTVDTTPPSALYSKSGNESVAGQDYSSFLAPGAWREETLQGNTAAGKIIPVGDTSGGEHAFYVTEAGVLVHQWLTPGSGNGCPSGNGNWSCEVVETGVTSIADADYLGGKLRLLYGKAPDIRYAEFVGAGGSGCVTGATPVQWSCQTVRAGAGVGYSRSSFDVAAGVVSVLVPNYGGGVGTMHYCQGSLSIPWACLEILSTVQGYDARPAIALTSSGAPRIAYLSHFGYVMLVYASCSANCTTSPAAWTTQYIDNVYYGSSSSQTSVAMEIDPSNVAHIAYTDNLSRYIYYATNSGTAAGCNSNLTPAPVVTTPGWRCSYVDAKPGNGGPIEMSLWSTGTTHLPRFSFNANSTSFYQPVPSGGNCRAREAGANTWTISEPTKWVCDTAKISTGRSYAYLSVGTTSAGQPMMGGEAGGLSIVRSPLLHTFDLYGNAGVSALGDGLYDAQLTGFQSARAYLFELRQANNTAAPVATWRGRDLVMAPTSASPVRLQVYRYGTVWRWEDVDIDTSSAMNTDFFLTTAGWAPSGPNSDYSFSRGGGSYGSTWRVLRAPSSNGLLTEYFGATLPSALRVESRTTGGALITSSPTVFNVSGPSPVTGATTASIGAWQKDDALPGSYTVAITTPPVGYVLDAASPTSVVVPSGGTGTLVLVFRAIVPPTVSSPSATAITLSSATLGATVTSNGGGALTARGTCWGVGSSPVMNCAAEGGTTVSSYSHARSGMSPNTTYFARGYATNAIGTGYSSDVSFRTLPGTPGSPTFSNVQATALRVSWTAPAGGAASYKLYRCTGIGCTPTLLQAGVGSTSYDDSGLTPATTYRYQVKATNATGDGAFSAISDITTTTPPANTGPTAAILQGLPTSFVGGKWYTIIARGTDEQGGNTLSPSWGYAPGSSSTGEFQNETSVVSGNDVTSTVEWRALQPGSYKLQFTVVDTGGLSASAPTPPTGFARPLPTWVEVRP